MVIIKVKVIPKSKHNQIVGYENDTLKIKINAPLEKQKANKELIYFLAKTLSISVSNITILSGRASRIKKIQIENISKEQFSQAIDNK
jgi:uncharacterized protein (TIGR00251 family)